MFKEIVSDYKELRLWLSDWIFCKRRAIKMSLAIRLADIKQRAFNKQYHVMLMYLPSGDKLVSVNRDEIVKMKRKKWLPKNMSMLDMKDSIFYSTPLSRNNKSTIEERKEARDKYVRYSRNIRGLAG
jgi:hypothetical protein